MYALATLALSLLACGPKAPSGRSPRVDPAIVVEKLRAQRASYALKGQFSISVRGPGTGGSTTGGLILHAPNSLRVDLLTPLRTPFYALSADGKALHLWSPRANTFYRGDDAVAVLGQLSGGAIQTADLLSILTADLPFANAPVLFAEVVPEGVHVLLGGPERARAEAWVNPRRRRVERLRFGLAADPQSSPISQTYAEVVYTDFMKVGREQLPEELVLTVPTLGWTVELEFDVWDELGVIPNVFTLAPPPGVVEKDLVGAITELAASKTPAAP